MNAQPCYDTDLDTVIHGECLAVLRGMPDNSVDAIVTDPPAGIAFMGKEWDNFTGKEKKYDSKAAKDASYDAYGKAPLPYGFSSSSGQPTRKERDTFIAFLREVMTEALRVLKPGGHALVWALPRTSHWTALALEDAGFEVREKLYHIFGSGFPKSLDIGKAIDKMQGAEREVIGHKPKMGGVVHRPNGTGWDRPWQSEADAIEKKLEVTAPATPEAQKWQGWGSATKPAVEEWILCRKPLAEPSIAANVLKYGTGGLNVDASRIAGHWTSWTRKDGTISPKQGHSSPLPMNRAGEKAEQVERNPEHPQGRFPSHLLLSHSLWCTPQHEDPSCPIAEMDRQSGVRKSTGGGGYKVHGVGGNGIYGNFGGKDNPKNVGYGDVGTVSRYFTNFPPDAPDFVPYHYFPKSSRRERNAGCEGLPEVDTSEITGRKPGSMGLIGDSTNKGQTGSPHCGVSGNPRANVHPTVKPLVLMRWLIRLITPPGGVVLDCFAGSGSTCVAAIHEGVHFIGIEQSSEYVAIAEARIAHAQREAGVPVAQEYDCAPDCPIRILGEQSGERKSGGHTKHKSGEVFPWNGQQLGIRAETYVRDGGEGTAARYFEQFPPDSLFAEVE